MLISKSFYQSIGRLTSLEEEKLKSEHEQLLIDIESCKNTLSNQTIVNEIIKNELLELGHKYGQPRKTVIDTGSKADLVDSDLIENNK